MCAEPNDSGDGSLCGDDEELLLYDNEGVFPWEEVDYDPLFPRDLSLLSPESLFAYDMCERYADDGDRSPCPRSTWEDFEVDTAAFRYVSMAPTVPESDAVHILPHADRGYVLLMTHCRHRRLLSDGMVAAMIGSENSSFRSHRRTFDEDIVIERSTRMRMLSPVRAAAVGEPSAASDVPQAVAPVYGVRTSSPK
jgi:hypothetical protein